MTLRNFAQIVGFNRVNVRGFKRSLEILEEAGALKVKQGGFIAHSMCHPKIVYVYDWDKVKLHFGPVTISKEIEPEYYYESDKKDESQYTPSFCVSERQCRYQFTGKDLPYPLCTGIRQCKQRIGANLTRTRVKGLLKEMFPTDERELFFN